MSILLFAFTPVKLFKFYKFIVFLFMFWYFYYSIKDDKNISWLIRGLSKIEHNRNERQK